MKRVLFVHTGKRPEFPGGCEVYRALVPLTHLHRNGWTARSVYFSDMWADYQKIGPSFWSLLLSSYDIFVFPRIYASTGIGLEGITGFFHLAKQLGKKIVYEVDDDYSNRYRHVIDGNAIDVAAQADAITVTTPFLAETMRSLTDKPVYVLPNMIEPAIWRDLKLQTRLKPEYKSKIIIGLTGSPTHHNDWIVLKDVLPPLLEGNPDIHLILMGFQPDYLTDLPRTTYLNFSEYVTYSQVIRNCDIILAPVNPTDQFNMGKSPIKAVEGQAARRILPNSTPAGAAVIATGNPVYKLAIEHGNTGLLVDQTPDAWRNAILRAVNDQSLREKMQVNGHKFAYRKFNIADSWKLWSDTYKKIMSA